MNLFESLPAPMPLKDRHSFEVALARRIAKDDEDAINELVMANLREAMLYTRKVSRNADDGVLMSVCYEALRRSAKRFDPSRQRFFAFAKAGLRGAMYRHYNKEQRHATVPCPELMLEKPTKTPAFLNSDEGHEEEAHCSQVIEADYETIFTRDRWAKIEPILKKACNEQEQMVLTLTYISGFNFQETGELLSVSRSAVQRTHVRALKKVRIELAQHPQLFV